MPFVHINWLEGRSVDQKRELARRVTEAVSEVAKIPPDRVHVIFRDMKTEDYGAGGELFIDRK